MLNKYYIVPLLLISAHSTILAQSPIIRGDALECFQINGAPASNRSLVDVEGQPFTRALRARGTAAANPWDTRLRCVETEAVSRADTIVATFWARLASEEPQATIALVVEKVAAPYTKSVQTAVGLSPNWRKFEIPFNMAEDYPAGSPSTANSSYHITFWLGYGAAQIEIGGLALTNRGSNVPFNTLGLTDWPYSGRGADAPWRAAAAERIDKYRKTDLLVAIRDAAGAPRPEVRVRVRMLRHAFPFGSAVDGGTLMSNSRYQDAIKELFNAAVTENDLKWPYFETWSRSSASFSLDWLNRNGLRVRGHTLIWPGRGNLPPDVNAMLDRGDKDAVRARIARHFAAITEFARDKVYEWDVLNEPVTNRDVQALLGDAEMAVWFGLAREAAPGVRLYINDFNITEGGGFDLQRQNAFFNIAKAIADAGAPLDAIGLQSHFRTTLTAPERVLEIYDRFASFGAGLAVTEYDYDTSDDALQAEYLRDYLTASFSHPAMRGFFIWGFWEGRHWRPQAAMIRRDWSTKPAYDVWRQLIFKDWWTNAEGQTAEDGTFSLRGFCGDYEIDVTLDGETKTYPLTLTPGETAHLILPPPEARASGAPIPR